jgi:Zn-dependent protease with chaperone function
MDDRIGRLDHLGVWRAICATPSIAGSVLVLAAGFGWLDEWANLVLAGWLLIALLLLSRPAERAAVTLAYGYGRLTRPEWTVLAPAARDAMRRCGRPSNTVDFYLRWRVPGVNGFAAGGWSVAVSRGLVDALRQRTLSQDQAAAIVTHDLLTAPLTGTRRMPLPLPV